MFKKFIKATKERLKALSWFLGLFRHWEWISFFCHLDKVLYYSLVDLHLRNKREPNNVGAPDHWGLEQI